MTSQIDPSTPSASPAQSRSTLQVWFTAITKPSVTAYRSLIGPSVNKYSPYVWIFVATIISGGISYCVSSSQITSLARTGGGQAPIDGSSILTGPLSVIFAIPGLILTAGAAQGVAKSFGGRGNYQLLVYLVAAIQAPLGIISGVVGIIPLIGPIISAGLLIYGVILIIIAVEAVNNIGWGKAILSGLAGIVVNIVVFGCVTIFFLTILGPGLDNSFYNIISTLEP